MFTRPRASAYPTLFLCLTAAALPAQTPTRASHTAPPPSPRFHSSWYAESVTFAEPPVRGLPYTALLVTTITVPGAPGNGTAPGAALVIVEQRAMQYRDREGRTRTEQLTAASQPGETGPTPGRREIEATDLVSHCQFHWTESSPGGPPAGNLVASVSCRARTVRYTLTNPFRTVEDQVRREDRKGNQLILTEPLGEKTIDGVPALGLRRTIDSAPPNPLAPARPSRPPLVTETWWSPTLQEVIRFGPIPATFDLPTFDLTNIRPLDPNPSLFYPPSNYRIVGPGDPAR